MSRGNGSRRDFIRTTAYVAPAILTLTASPAFAGTGSVRPSDKPTSSPNGNNGVPSGVDQQPRGNPPINDGPVTTSPGNSGNRGGGPQNGTGNDVDPQPRGNPPINDGGGTSPGNQGNRGGGGGPRGGR